MSSRHLKVTSPTLVSEQGGYKGGQNKGFIMETSCKFNLDNNLNVNRRKWFSLL